MMKKIPKYSPKSLLKIMYLSLFALLLSLSVSMSASAETDSETTETLDLSEYILQVGGFGFEENNFETYTQDEPSLLSSDDAAVEAVILDGLRNKSSEIYLAPYNVSSSTFFSQYTRVINRHPELFYVTGGVSYSLSGNIITTIYPRYDSDYSDADIANFNQRLNQITASVDSSWPVLEKVLYLHDYLVTNVEYDQTYSKYNAYNALVEGSSVCQGYSLAMICLMNNIGVDCDIITSRDLNHAWNLIALNGEYFYVDATWDDPLGCAETYCRHSNFMIDQTRLVEAGHDSTDWYSSNMGTYVYDVVATSSRYNDFFWKDMISAVPLIGTNAGYLTEGKLDIYDFASGLTKSYDRVVERWYVWNSSSWWGGDYCSMAAYGDAFYYTTPKSIYYIKTDGTTQKVYTLSEAEANIGYIYGLKTSGRDLIYILQTIPNGTATGSGIYRIESQIENFVTRMYQQCLSRDPDSDGLNGWVSQLENGYMDGAAIAQQFIFSEEMLSKNLSSEDFVKVLYRAMMNREADESGLNGWLNQLNKQYMTRTEITKSFVESTEFTDICNSYGITRGIYDASIAPIEHFVSRFYTLCLERNADQAGLYGWVNNLKNQYMNGAQIANAFFFGTEFIDRDVSNDKFVELLYQTLMGRTPDESGKSGWVYQLDNQNATRSELTQSFVESTEFTDICSQYGIIRGDYDVSLAPLEHFVSRFYNLCLERSADQPGLYGWISNLTNHYMNGAQIANSFFFGTEFLNRNVSDEKYIELLYNTLMGRSADESGKSGWVYQLKEGNMTRLDILKSFIESSEFTDICNTYGITRGSL